jgi:hypothetical protein
MNKASMHLPVPAAATKLERGTSRTLTVISGDDPDAAVIGALYRKARESIVDSVRHAIECGDRLRAKRNELGHGRWLAWLKANAHVLGFDSPRTADRLMRGAAKLDASVQYDEIAATQISREIWGHLGPVRGTAGTGEFERYTPPKYIEAARTVLGEIDLDPASCKLAQRTVQAARYFTFKDDGLTREWRGRIWLNPPYHRDLGPKFVDKLIAERVAGHVTAAIMLTNNCTDASWFSKASHASAAICFSSGRVNFLREDGVTPLFPTQGQAFFYFGDDVAGFKRGFNDIGDVMGLL